MTDGLKLLELLAQAQIEFVVVGALAATMHGATLVTLDVDVCLRFDQKNLKALAEVLGPFQPKHRMTPQRLPLEITDENWDRLKNIYLETEIGILDCLGEIKGIGKYEDALNLSVVADLPFGPCRVLSLDALIRAKESVGRPQDIATVRQLRLIKAKHDSAAT